MKKITLSSVNEVSNEELIINEYESIIKQLSEINHEILLNKVKDRLLNDNTTQETNSLIFRLINSQEYTLNSHKLLEIKILKTLIHSSVRAEYYEKEYRETKKERDKLLGDSALLKYVITENDILKKVISARHTTNKESEKRIFTPNLDLKIVK